MEGSHSTRTPKLKGGGGVSMRGGVRGGRGL